MGFFARLLAWGKPDEEVERVTIAEGSKGQAGRKRLDTEDLEPHELHMTGLEAVRSLRQKTLSSTVDKISAIRQEVEELNDEWRSTNGQGNEGEA